MAKIRLLDSTRMSKLLEDALSWSPVASSFLVSASNGSILAYAFRGETPSIKDMRTLSTTMTTAYTAVSSEESLVYESQPSSTISVIAPVADHILLAVTGEGSINTCANTRTTDESESRNARSDADTEDDASGQEGGRSNGVQAETRHELEAVSEELAMILRGELRDLRWPDDI